MECPVCLEGYSSDASLLPKLTPCGHLACAGCLRRVQHCPRCRKAFTGPADALPTVFDNIGGQERPDGPSGWWCSECDAAASAQCRDNHLILRVQVALRRQAAKLAPLASEAVQGLENAVQAAAEEPARLALQLLADGDAPAEGELTVRRGGSAVGAQWRLEEGGAASGLMARTLLCQLAAEGTLQHKTAAQAAVLESPIIPELDVSDSSTELVNTHFTKKKEVLQLVRRHGVRRIKGLFFRLDPAWSLELLKAAAATLEELQLFEPHPEHLLAAHNAPRLRRLDVHGDREEDNLTVDGQPLVLPALATPSSLQWLRVHRMPRATLRSLLLAHAASLRTLVLLVDTPGAGCWPLFWCPDLVALLGGCGLAALTKLRLIRFGGHTGHKKPGCEQQIQALRRLLPGAAVQCDVCEGGGFDAALF